MFKKVFTIFLVLVGIFALAACKPDDTPDPDEPTTLELISEAMDLLDLPSEANSDLLLQVSLLHDVTVTWESSNEAVIATDGTLVVPTFSEGNKTVTLTAYLTLDDETLTKTFDVSVAAALVKTDEEKVDEAIVTLNTIPEGSITMDVDLPLTALEATISWASDNEAVMTAAGVITRPDVDEADVVVTLTGTVTVGTESKTVTKVFTVMAEESATVYTSVATIFTTAIPDEYMEFTGIVVFVSTTGYFLSDGTDSIGVYANNDNAIEAVIGDEINVRGYYGNYNTMKQITDIDKEVKNSSGNANPLVGTETAVTVGEFIALDSSIKEIHGAYYEVTGTVEVRVDGIYSNVFLVDGDDEIMVTYYSPDAAIAVLETFDGREVTIIGVYYAEHGTNGPLLGFDGTADDVVVAALPDAELLALDVLALPTLVNPAYINDLVLPVVGPNGSTFGSWASSNATVVNDAGEIVGVVTENTTVTFTGTATKGLESEAVTFDVVITVAKTLEEAMAMEIGSFFQVTGIVYEDARYGFYIENNGTYAYIPHDDYSDTLAVGDEVSLLGFTGFDYGALQINVVSDFEVLSTGNPDVVPVVSGTVSGIVNGLYQRGTRVELTASVTREGSYDNVYLTDFAGGKVVVFYNSNDDELFGFEDKMITLTVVTYQDGMVLYQGVTADVVEVTDYTDADKANAVIDSIDLGDLTAVNMNLVLPGDSTDPAYTVSWATSDAAVVTDAGVITMVSGSNPTATLTATVVLGTETVTRDFVVTLMDSDDNVPLSVTDALLVADGNTVIVQGVIVGMFYDDAIVQDAAGAAIYIADIDGALGDEVIAVGTLGTNADYGDNQRILDAATKLSTESTGNDLVVSATTDVATILGEVPMMYRYTATLTVTSLSDGYGYALFNTVDVDGDQENGFKIKLSNDVPEYFADFYAVDDTIELTFTVSDIDYSNARVVSVVWPTLTDADMVQAAVNSIEIPMDVVDDLTPPAEVYGATITWTSDTPAVIANDGTVTRPLEGQPDATVILTGVFVLNAVTVTETWTVNVPAIPAPVSYDFTETFTNLTGLGGSYDLGSFAGDNSITWAYTESRGDFTLDGQAIMLDKDGDGASLIATITGGISAFSIEYYDAYSGSAQVVVIINEGLANEVTYTSVAVDYDESPGVQIGTFEVSGIDLSGEFTVSIYSGESQMVLDNFSWAGYTE